jgi:hypothetical protein
MLDELHPDYVRVHPDWVVASDAYAGERCIKEKSFTYLPATSGQIEDGALRDPSSIGRKAYDAYLLRALFPDYVKEAVQTLVGVMHREPAEIKLPAALEPMRELATRKGETLLQLLRRINEQQILLGRFGLLADVLPDRTVPHLVGYPAQTIRNWDDRNDIGLEDLSLVVLDESRAARSGFGWVDEKRHRALLLGQEDILGDGQGPKLGGESVYWSFVEVEGQPRDLVVPEFAGRRLTKIPFVIVGANDLDPVPDDVPMLGLARLALAIYRGEADYRQTLFLQGQATLVIIGQDSDEGDKKESPTRTGAGAVLHVPLQGDAKYIGAPSDGIAEQRQALEADRAAAREKGSQLLHPPGSQAESGEALKIRVAASTASLFQIALTGAAGLEKILRICAEWVGADPDEVKVTPNLEFAETPEPPQSVSFLMDAKEKGLPLSQESIHRWLVKNRYTAMTFDEEQAAIEDETPEEPQADGLVQPDPSAAPAAQPPRVEAPAA